MTPAKTNPPLNGTPKMAPHWSRTRSPTLNRWNWTVTFLKKKQSMDDFLKASGNTGLFGIFHYVYMCKKGMIIYNI